MHRSTRTSCICQRIPDICIIILMGLGVAKWSNPEPARPAKSLIMWDNRWILCIGPMSFIAAYCKFLAVENIQTLPRHYLNTTQTPQTLQTQSWTRCYLRLILPIIFLIDKVTKRYTLKIKKRLLNRLHLNVREKRMERMTTRNKAIYARGRTVGQIHFEKLFKRWKVDPVGGFQRVSRPGWFPMTSYGLCVLFT